MNRNTLAALPLLMLLVAGCDPVRAPDGVSAIRIDTVADTVTVRNPAQGAWDTPRILVPSTSVGVLDGAPEESFGRVSSITAEADGRLYVLDGQAATIRAFEPDGSYVRSLGRRGEGPGEFTAPNAIGVRPDGHVLARDPRNRRVQVFDPSGSDSDEWDILTPTVGSSHPIWTDSDNNSYVTTGAIPPGASPLTGVETIVLRVSPGGDILDTIRDLGATAPPELIAEASIPGGSSVYRSNVPFFPQDTWAFLPTGGLLRGMADGSGVEVLARDGSVRRITRDFERVPVTTGERRFERAQVVDGMRRVVSDWTWNGPDIPEVKPLVRRVFAGLDGRIWVQIFAEGYRDENSSLGPDVEPDLRTPWREPLVFDVYEADGTYLGQVTPPDEFRLFPTPVFDAEGAWAVTRDELGVQRVGWFSLELNNAF